MEYYEISLALHNNTILIDYWKPRDIPANMWCNWKVVQMSKYRYNMMMWILFNGVSVVTFSAQKKLQIHLYSFSRKSRYYV